MTTTASESPRTVNVTQLLDAVEQIVSTGEWVYERREGDISVQIPGRWCDYSGHFAWVDDMECLVFSCALDMRVAPNKMKEAYELIGISNEKISIGFFTTWTEERMLIFRIVVPMRGQKAVSPEQIEDVIEDALNECERFYPAFQYVIWGGKTPQDALQLAIIETEGEA